MDTAEGSIKTNTDTITALGESAAKALGGGSTYSNGTLTAKLTVGGTAYDSVQKALNAVSAEAGAKGSWTLQANGANGAVIGDGGTVNLAESSNITVTADGQGNVTFGMKENPTFGDVVTAKGFTVASGGSGIDMNGTKVTNLAEGDISKADSKDAVTGGQLFTAKSALESTIDTTKAALETTISETESRLNSSITAVDDVAVKYASKDSKRLTLTDSGNSVKIGNVADGTADTDAANVGQMKAAISTAQNTLQTNIENLGDSAAKALGGTSKFENGTLTAGLTVGDQSDLTVQEALNAVNTEAEAKGSWTLQANGGSSYTVNAGSTVNLVQDGNITVTADGQGNVTFGMKENPTFGDVVTAKGFTIASGGSGIDMNGTKVTNLAEGDISSADSTDAVTGGQLFTAKDELTKSICASQSALQGEVDALGGSIASALGGSSSFDAGTNAVTASFTRQFADVTRFGGYDSVQKVIDSIDKQFASIGGQVASIMGGGVEFNGDGTGTLSGFSVEINGETFTDVASAIGKLADGWTFAPNDSTPSGGQGGAGTGAPGSTTIRPGDTLTVNAGNNIDISGSDGNYTIGVTPTPTFENVTTDTATVNDTLTIGSGGNTVTASGGNLTATGNVTGAAGSFGDGKVTADASGVTVTGADGSSSVKIDGDSVSVADTVTIDKDGADMGGTKVTNMAEGSVQAGSTDAVTGSQLWDAYQRIGMLDGELRERINVVGAHAAALSGLHPIQYNPYEPTTLSAAIGTYRDEYAVAVGVFHYYRENVLFNLGASLCSDGDLMGRMGVSFAVGKSTKRRPELARDMVGMQRQMYVMQAKLERLESENRQSEAAEAKLREENAQNRRIIEQNAATLRKNEEIMKKNAELIRELTKKLEAQK